MINFNIPFSSIDLSKALEKLVHNKKFSGDGPITKECNQFLTKYYNAKALLTTSCSHALEMAAILADVQHGDEIIMPSFTFVSTANAFVLRGAKIVFIDIRPDNMNIDERLIENAITAKTKAIVPVHYGGVACNMDIIQSIAQKHNLYVIEDAAQCIGATFKGQRLGSFGDFGTISFHDTKNIHSGEGGVLIIKDERDFELAEIIREKGTNRSKFLRGMVDKYTWVNVGSSYLPSELNAAFLLPQLNLLESITQQRIKIWDAYKQLLMPLMLKEYIEIAKISEDSRHNGHLFYIKCHDIVERQQLIAFLHGRGISTAFHYIPLHSSPAGLKYGRFHGVDNFTTKESERLLRLPLHYYLTYSDVEFICDSIKEFYATHNSK